MFASWAQGVVYSHVRNETAVVLMQDNGQSSFLRRRRTLKIRKLSCTHILHEFYDVYFPTIKSVTTDFLCHDTSTLIDEGHAIIITIKTQMHNIRIMKFPVVFRRLLDFQKQTITTVFRNTLIINIQLWNDYQNHAIVKFDRTFHVFWHDNLKK